LKFLVPWIDKFFLISCKIKIGSLALMEAASPNLEK